jgi:hypothetical protein
MCLKAIADFHYGGEPIQRMREGELFELKEPIQRTLDPDRPCETTINANQVWHALLGVGNELRPFHCLSVPLWVGGVRLDGEIPSKPQHLADLTRLKSFDERRSRTRLDVGPTDQGTEVFAVQRLLFACYTAWLHDVVLLMDA